MVYTVPSEMIEPQLIRKFWSFVDKTDDGCWEFRHKRVNDYGRMKFQSKHIRAHRLSWEIHNGPIPDGMYVCHHCDNKKCVRPDHLFIGTHRDNLNDFVSKCLHYKGRAKKIVCSRGHLMIGENVYGAKKPL